MITGLVIAVATILATVLIAHKLLTRKDRGQLPSFVIDRASIPFNLFLDDTLVEEHPGIQHVLQNAVDYVNDSIGHPMFAAVGTFSAGAIVPVMRYDSSMCESAFCFDNAFAFTKIVNGKAEAIYVNSDLYKGLDESLAVYGLAHELGHVLGLDHDDFILSLMYPKLVDREPELTSKDVEVLRLAYGLPEVGKR